MSRPEEETPEATQKATPEATTEGLPKARPKARTIVITGASDGIGKSAAFTLHAAHQYDDSPTELVLVGRNPEKTRSVAQQINAKYYTADFSDLSEVRALAQTLKDNHPHIDVLANNAGGYFDGPLITKDGYELTWQVNYAAPFLLTTLLLDKLISANATVVNTSSVAAQYLSRFSFKDTQSLSRFSSRRAYGNSKLAQVMFTHELHRRFHSQGLNAVAFHPGVIATNFASGTRGLLALGYHSPARKVMSDVAKGGENLAYFIDGTPDIAWKSGLFYNDRRTPGKIRKIAYDDSSTEKLYDMTERYLQLREH
ncbi:SDR family NAD(P)-dependent oxidoreductase [Corynebacterium sp. H78]|uniref:SDR family NAD(P)-dependent oxidoreductase n=1 Tax=Corynebacterium sp. H78 TaxID=3133417 RepID=UPI0030AE8531